MLAGTTVSLPMYVLPEMEDANAAFLTALQQRLCIRGIDTANVVLGHNDNLGLESVQPLFTQICGYPLFKHYRGHYRMLGTPHYAMSGCVGSHHRAFFMVRADDPAKCLEDLRGRIFGCNSLLSNSGMNLPRLSLARIAGARAFFSSIVMTGGHVASLERLEEGSIDLCSVDSVTWGFFKRFRSAAAERYRILAETVSSPCLPFVTSVHTSEADAAGIAQTLHEIMNDPEIAEIREVLALAGLSVPDVAAYERLAQYELEAIALGFPEIR
jgi:ABC-type phosphate/phosphonate transport system substrate-binding protein